MKEKRLFSFFLALCFLLASVFVGCAPQSDFGDGGVSVDQGDYFLYALAGISALILVGLAVFVFIRRKR